MARILIADDERHSIRILALWLQRNGHDVFEAYNGELALAKFDDVGGEVDLVVSDMNMPTMDGLEFITALRQERGCDVPVIMFSSRCDQDSLKKRVEPLGVTLYPKPFVPSRLVARIDELLTSAVQ